MIVLEFQLTQAAQVLVVRLEKLKIEFPDISYDYVAESFSKLFDVFSEKISTYSRRKLAKSSDRCWYDRT